MRTGVLRAEVDLISGGLEQTGCMTVKLDDDEVPTDPVVWYVLSKGHLLELLAAARVGATNSDLLLALDAAALTDHDHPL